jgi:hypothetical protein
MKHNSSAISNLIFATAIVVLVVVACVGFGLYEVTLNGSVTSQHTVTVTALSTQVTTTTENSMMVASSEETAMISSSTMMGENSSSNSSGAFMFSPISGTMISNAWLITSQAGMNEFAVAIHTEGLEPNRTYIIEGTLATGSMNVVPISSLSMSMNTISGSEFQADRNGAGTYWIVLDSNPIVAFENVQILYLPGMSMSNATEVASLSFVGENMMTTATSMMATSG